MEEFKRDENGFYLPKPYYSHAPRSILISWFIPGESGKHDFIDDGLFIMAVHEIIGVCDSRSRDAICIDSPGKDYGYTDIILAEDEPAQNTKQAHFVCLVDDRVPDGRSLNMAGVSERIVAKILAMPLEFLEGLPPSLVSAMNYYFLKIKNSSFKKELLLGMREEQRKMFERATNAKERQYVLDETRKIIDAIDKKLEETMRIEREYLQQKKEFKDMFAEADENE